MHTVSLTHQLVAIQDDFDLDKIIESGQCFQPQKLSDGRYRFLSGSALLYLTPADYFEGRKESRLAERREKLHTADINRKAYRLQQQQA